MDLATNRHRLLTVTGVAGIGYALSWIAGLSVPGLSPKLTASGAEIVAALAGHGTAVATQFALTEGLPAVGLAIISIALARAARRSGAAGAARVARSARNPRRTWRTMLDATPDETMLRGAAWACTSPPGG
jgi:hypothetical protein